MRTRELRVLLDARGAGPATYTSRRGPCQEEGSQRDPGRSLNRLRRMPEARCAAGRSPRADPATSRTPQSIAIRYPDPLSGRGGSSEVVQMPLEVTMVSALLVGLLGSSHCLGMCGGIAGSLSLSSPRGQHAGRSWLFLLAYNGGRICSYAIAGALLGWISQHAFDAMPAPAARHAAQWISAGFMIALGLYLSGWWRGLALLERAGAGLWRHLAPLARRLLPVRHPLQAWLFGMVWGWLPCGLVYSALAWSLSAGSPASGALLMAAFGAGTLPMLLVSGGAARALGTAVRSSRVRRASGVVVLAFGVYALLPLGGHDAHRHHQGGATPPASQDG